MTDTAPAAPAVTEPARETAPVTGPENAPGTAPEPGTARKAVSIAGKLAQFSELWAQRTVATVNDYEVKVAKVHGEFVWHRHDDTDEFFLVVSGRLTIQLRDGDVVLGPGEMYVVPKGVEHCPLAEEETAILLLEPAGTSNTGSAGGPRTKAPVAL
ncbi:cupin domain-containing protein [Streptomyces sp. HPF1205]|uniref:cupin domain-containing protein n=1 Tax=Streptomyces sp. HPF1205 TaxID=2873262 RepID=UPI0021F1F435|nr:cupin domain-containing protein [Streptomyces sp. HPF1205]